MKKRNIIIGVLILLVIILIVVIFYFNTGSKATLKSYQVNKEVQENIPQGLEILNETIINNNDYVYIQAELKNTSEEKFINKILVGVTDENQKQFYSFEILINQTLKKGQEITIQKKIENTTKKNRVFTIYSIYVDK